MAPRVVWDPATGQYVMAKDGTGGATTTTAPAMGPFSPATLPAGIGPQQLAALGLGPNATTTTAAPVKTRVTKPKTPATTTTVAPKVTVPTGRGSGAKAAPTTTTTTTVPAKPVQVPVQGPALYGTADQIGTPTYTKNAQKVAADAAATAAGEDASGLFGTTGTTGSGSSAATKAAQNAQNYAQGSAAAKYLLKTSQQQQGDYNALGNQTYANMLAGFNPSYDAQVAKLRETLAANQTAGETQISQAQADLMKQLQPDTTYQNAPVVQLSPEQQALGNALQAYGASDQLAKNANASQQQINQQIADMFRNTNTQLNQAQQNYYTGMQNAAAQNAAQAKTNLATNTTTALQQLLGQIEGNRAGAISNAEQARQQLQTAGLTAAQQGKSDYATTMAKLIAAYGTPKKTTKKKVK